MKSGRPQKERGGRCEQFNRLLHVIGRGVARSSKDTWQSWIGDKRTPAFFQRLCNLGIDAAELLLLAPVQKDTPSRPAVISLKKTDWFLSPEAAIYWLAEAHEHFKGPFTDADFNRLRREIPDEPKSGHLPIRVPVWYENTVQVTFERQVHLLQRRYGNQFWRWPELQSDVNSLRLLGGNDRHRGQCLDWATLDLNPVPECNQKPCVVRSPDTSPGPEVMAVVAINRTYVLEMQSRNKPCLWLPGYECNIDVDPSWHLVPFIWFHDADRQVELTARWCGNSNGRWSMPILLQSSH